MCACGGWRARRPPDRVYDVQCHETHPIHRTARHDESICDPHTPRHAALTSQEHDVVRSFGSIGPHSDSHERSEL